MGLRRRGVATAFTASLLLALVTGCGSDGGEESGGSSTTASTADTTSDGACEASGWEWDDDDPACDAPVDPATEGADDATPGAATTGGGSEPPASGEASATSTASDAVDPCTWVSAAEWEDAAGVAGVEQIPLEDGEACGFVESDDEIRLAIGFVPQVQAGHRFLDGAADPGDPVPGLPDAVWLTGYPVDQSSVLVVARSGGDLVLEVSTLEPPTDAQRDAAIAAATLALGRL